MVEMLLQTQRQRKSCAVLLTEKRSSWANQELARQGSAAGWGELVVENRPVGLSYTAEREKKNVNDVSKYRLTTKGE